jgi:alpha-tubulin suppressor-like RCC1 family protein
MRAWCLVLAIAACGDDGSSQTRDADMLDGSHDGFVGSDACVAQITAGPVRTCARRGDGSTWCWGANDQAQLGIGVPAGQTCGPRTCEPSPHVLSTLDSSSGELEAGGLHTCAIQSDGSVWCWGLNNSGQTGTGGTFGFVGTPARASVIDSVVEIAVGGAHTCARKADGTLWCWGWNGKGQLGDGTQGGTMCSSGLAECKLVPVQVSALADQVVEVTASFGHSCARKSDGTVWCWGLDYFGQLGDGVSSGVACADGGTNCQPSPVQVEGLTDVAEIESGTGHTCARKIDGTMWCWGLNANGQLGIDSTTPASSPQQVVALGNEVRRISLGQNQTCAIKADASLWCWGENRFGELGDGTTVDRKIAVPVTAAGTVDMIVSTEGHTCARRTDDTLICWGSNIAGQLGNGTFAGSQACADTKLNCELTPVSVSGLCAP